jgi:hypothetical protein
MSTISGVSGSGSNAWAALNTQRTNHQARMFAKVDADGSGNVDQAELTTMLDHVSQKTGASFDDVAKVFTSMDANSDGSLSSDELDSGMKSLMQAQSSTVDFAQARKSGGSPDGEGGGPRGAGGPPPAGAAGGSSSASSTSSSSTTYDPLDTNQDGTVSLTERLAGNVKSDPLQALFKAIDSDNNGAVSSTATTDSASSQGFDIAKLAQMLYDKVAGGLATSTRSTSLSAVA